MLAAIAVILSGGCESPPAYKQPPDSSYTRATYQLKLGEAVTPGQGAQVTAEFFAASEVRPFLGRFFIESDRASSATPVTVLSHALWTERFGAVPSVIGGGIEIDARPFTIVGVAPPGFQFPEGALLWTPTLQRAPDDLRR